MLPGLSETGKPKVVMGKDDDPKSVEVAAIGDLRRRPRDMILPLGQKEQRPVREGLL